MTAEDHFDAARKNAVRFWLTSTYAEMDRNPPAELFAVLRGSNRAEDLTVPVVNNAKALIRVVFPETPRGPVNQPDQTGIQGSMISLYVYYKLLDALVKHLLLKNSAGLELDKNERSAMTKRLQNSHFHNALLCLVTEMVAYAFHDSSFPWSTQKLRKIHHSFEIWIVIDYVMKINDHLQLPPLIVGYLDDLQECIITEHCFLYHSSLYTYCIEGGGCLHQAGNHAMIETFIVNFSIFVLKSTELICGRLTNKSDQNEEPFSKHCSDLVDRVLYKHLYLFFGRKTIIPILCSIYCVGEMLRMKYNFDDLIQEATKTLYWTDVIDIEEVLLSRCTKTGTSFGSIQQFHNECFLPCCQNDIEELKDDVDNQTT